MGCKMQNFSCRSLLNSYFFIILAVYDFMLELSKVLLNTSSKYTAVNVSIWLVFKWIVGFFLRTDLVL